MRNINYTKYDKFDKNSNLNHDTLSYFTNSPFRPLLQGTSKIETVFRMLILLAFARNENQIKKKVNKNQ